MIFKSFCLQKPLHLYFWNHKNDRTCYAGRGLRTGTPRWGYPSHRFRGGPLHEATGGYAAPKAPAGQSCLDGEYFNAWPCQYDIDLNQINDKWYLGKLRCHSTDRTAITRHVNMEQLSCLARRDKALWFSTLLTTAIRRYVLTIRKLAD